MLVTYQAKTYSPELVTGKYVRVCSKYDDPKSIKPNFTFKVFETATCESGSFKGKAGCGCTLREYITDGLELPQELKEKCIKDKRTEKWWTAES